MTDVDCAYDRREARCEDGDYDPSIDWDFVPGEIPPCPVCSGPSFHLGTLGSREWFRCRACGLVLSLLTTETEEVPL